MFECILTGKEWGNKGEKQRIPDIRIIYAIKNKLIESDIIYIGDGSVNAKFRIESKEDRELYKLISRKYRNSILKSLKDLELDEGDI